MAAGIFLDLASQGILQAGNAGGTAISGTAGLTAVDLVDCGANMATATVTVSAVASSGNVTLKMQESATTTDGDFTDITSATFATALTAAAQTPQMISFQFKKRYVRVYATLVSGTSVTAQTLILCQRKTTPASSGGWTNETGGT